MGKGRVSGLGELFSEPIHHLGEMPSYFKLHSPEAVSVDLQVFHLECLLHTQLSAWGRGK